MQNFEEFGLTDLISVNTLQRIQDGFSEYAGLAALTTDATGTPVTNGSGFTDFCTNVIRKSELGCKRCHECDKQGALLTLEKGKAVAYNCHSGLVDFAAPIMVEGRVIGSFVGGQVRAENEDESQLRAIAAELGIDGDVYMESIRKVGFMEKEKIQKAAEFLTELTTAISEMAYKNYEALKKARKLERVARSQTSFMVEMNNNMRKSVQDWLQTANKLSGDIEHKKLTGTLDELKQKGDDFLKSVEESIDFARITDGDTELDEVFYDPRSLLGSIAEKAQNLVGDADVRIEATVDDSVPARFLGDEGRIAQILNKLTQNAILYTKKGSIEIRASAFKQSYAEMLKLEIRDTGRGMSESALHHIRDYIENSAVHYDSDSIGIRIIGVLVKMMSGTATIESAEGKGTVFTVTIPQIAVE